MWRILAPCGHDLGLEFSPYRGPFPKVSAPRNQIRGDSHGREEICRRGDRHVLADIRGCGSAVIAAGFPEVGIGLLGVSLAFGLTVVTMAYAIGHISGCHLNPAVTVGLAAGGRFPAGQILPYIVAQVVGAIVAAALLYVIASGAPASTSPRASRRTAMASIRPGKYSLVAGFITEVVMTVMFLFIIMGATHGKAPAGFAPLAIGLA